MIDDSKSSKNQSQNKHSKKIVINSKEDLNKLSFSVLKKTKIYEFEGDYFNFIYDRALHIEKNTEEKESILSSNNFTSNKNISKKVNTPKDHSKSLKAIKNIKKTIKKENNNSQDIMNKKAEKQNTSININNNYFEKDNYNMHDSKINSVNINQSLPLPTVNYSQEMSVQLLKKQLKIDYIIFQMKYNTRPGEDLGVIGSINELGMWDQNRALKLNWSDGNIWKTKISYNLRRNNSFEFKYIFIANGRVKQWEDGNNRKLVYEQLKDIIEPNIKEGYLMEFKNINGNNIIYNYKDCTLTVICDWNKK